MKAAWDNYKSRKKEVQQFVWYITSLLDSEIDPSEVVAVETKAQSINNIDIRIQKAMVIMLLYNLIESTTDIAFKSVFNRLISEDIDYDRCSEKIKQICLGNLRNYYRSSSFQANNEIVIAKEKKWSIGRYLVFHDFNTAELFSGNVDVKQIKEMCKKYGIEFSSNKNYTWVRQIKDKRNSLAHGVDTFSEVGRELSREDIIDAYLQTIQFLKSFLLSVELFLNNKKYRVP